MTARSNVYRLLVLVTVTIALADRAFAGPNPMAQCALVPAAVFTVSEDTAVGLISDSEGVIRWQFYDQEGRRRDSGSLRTNGKDLNGFVLSGEVSAGLSGVQGFLLFCLDDNDDDRIDFNDDPDLTANAFLIKRQSSDVAFIPVLPVFAENLRDEDLRDDVDDWDDDPIDELHLGAVSQQRLYMRYLTDSVAGGGDQTQIYVFTTRNPDDEEEMEAVGPGEERAVRVPMERIRLNVFDVESVPEMTSSGLLGSGFLIWKVSDDVKSAFAFSLVESPAFGAAQTLISSTKTELD